MYPAKAAGAITHGGPPPEMRRAGNLNRRREDIAKRREKGGIPGADDVIIKIGGDAGGELTRLR